MVSETKSRLEQSSTSRVCDECELFKLSEWFGGGGGDGVGDGGVDGGSGKKMCDEWEKGEQGSV